MQFGNDVEIPLWLDLAAVFVGALQGAMVGLRRPANRPSMSITGVVALAVVVGLGGGIVRDLLLARVPLSLQSNWYLFIVAVAVVVTLVSFVWLKRFNQMIALLDAVALGLYSGLGAFAAEGDGVAPLGAFLVGALAGTGGGLVRDILVSEVPQLMQPGQVYGVAAALTSGMYVLLQPTGLPEAARFAIAVLIGITLRMLTIGRGWSLGEARPLLGERSEAGDA